MTVPLHWRSSRSFEDNTPLHDDKENVFEDATDKPYQPLLRFTRRGYTTATIVLFLSIALLGFLYASNLTIRAKASKIGSFEAGFVTEIRIDNGFSEIQLEQVKFSGGLKYDEHGHLYRNVDPGQPAYVGAPSAGMDALWNELVHDRYVAFYGAEYQGPDLGDIHEKPPYGTYRIGVDVLHSLHCLNRIRKILEKDYYAEELAPEKGPHERLHVDHCIDYLRQMLQCKADLTPLPVYWSTGANRTVPDFDAVHVCRNFQKIRNWADEQEKSTMSRFPD